MATRNLSSWLPNVGPFTVQVDGEELPRRGTVNFVTDATTAEDDPENERTNLPLGAGGGGVPGGGTEGRALGRAGGVNAWKTTHELNHSIRTTRPPERLNILDYYAAAGITSPAPGNHLQMDDTAIHSAVAECMETTSAPANGRVPSLHFPGWVTEAGYSGQANYVVASKPIRIHKPIKITGEGAFSNLQGLFNGPTVIVKPLTPPTLVTGQVPAVGGQPTPFGWRSKRGAAAQGLNLSAAYNVWRVNGRSTLTIAGWIRLEANMGAGQIADLGGSFGELTATLFPAVTAWELQMAAGDVFATGGNTLLAYITINGVRQQVLPAAYTLTVGTVYFFALTYDGTTARLLINAQGDATLTQRASTAAAGTITQQEYEGVSWGFLTRGPHLTPEQLGGPDFTTFSLELWDNVKYVAGAAVPTTLTPLDYGATTSNLLFCCNFDTVVHTDVIKAYVAQNPSNASRVAWLPHMDYGIEFQFIGSTSTFKDIYITGDCGMLVYGSVLANYSGMHIQGRDYGLLFNPQLFGYLDGHFQGQRLGLMLEGNSVRGGRLSIIGAFGMVTAGANLDVENIVGSDCGLATLWCTPNSQTLIREILCDQEGLPTSTPPQIAGLILGSGARFRADMAYLNSMSTHPTLFTPRSSAAILIDQAHSCRIGPDGSLGVSSLGTGTGYVQIDRPMIQDPLTAPADSTCVEGLILDGTGLVDVASPADRNWPLLQNSTSLTIALSDNSNPANVELDDPHHLITGDAVYITGSANTPVNGAWYITKTGAKTFSLNGCDATAGSVQAGGTCYRAPSMPVRVEPFASRGAVTYQFASDADTVIPYNVTLSRYIKFTSAGALTATRKAILSTSQVGLVITVTNSTTGGQTINVVVGSNSIAVTNGATVEITL